MCIIYNKPNLVLLLTKIRIKPVVLWVVSWVVNSENKTGILRKRKRHTFGSKYSLSNSLPIEPVLPLSARGLSPDRPPIPKIKNRLIHCYQPSKTLLTSVNFRYKNIIMLLSFFCRITPDEFKTDLKIHIQLLYYNIYQKLLSDRWNTAL